MLKPLIQKFKTSDGLELAYTDEGTGPPLLCLAGLTRNMTDFGFVMPHIAHKARIICLDSRGRGASDFDPDYLNYNLIRESRDVVALLDHLGLEKTAILGTSRGGILGMILATSHKERLTGVCLNDIGPLIEPEGLAHIFSYLGIAPDFKTHAEAAEKMGPANAKRFPHVPQERWHAHALNLWREGPEGLELTYDAHLRNALLEQSATDAITDLWLIFDALEGLPTGLIRGANSDVLSHDTAAEMCKRRPDMFFAEVPDRGHVPFLDEPEALGVIARFIETLR